MTALILLFLGLIFTLSVSDLQNRNLSFILSIPIGAVVWVIACFALLLFDISLGITNIVVAALAITAVIRAAMQERPFTRKHALGALYLKVSSIPIALLAASYVASVLFPDVIISQDSLILTYMGFLVSEGVGSMNEFGEWYIWGYPTMIPLTSFHFDNVDLKHFSSLPLAASFSVISAVIYASYTRLRAERYPVGTGIAISALITLFTFSSEVSIYNIFYLNHHSSTSAYLLLFALALSWKVTSEKNSTGIGVVIVMLITGVALSRHEGPFISLAMIMLFAERFRHSPKWMIKVSTISASCILLYLLYMLNHGAPTPGTVLSEKIIWIMIAGNILTITALIGLLYTGHIESVLKNAFYLLLSILLAAQVAGFLFNHDVYVVSIGCISKNLFGGQGFWGATWYIMLAAFVFSAMLSRKLSIEHKLITIFSLLVMSMPVIRDMPFRTGIGDSANRMFLHILPLSSLLVINLFISLRRRQISGIYTGK